MDLGAEQSGRARVVWAIDNEHWAVETYRSNLGRHIVEADITETAVPAAPCDILLAGPPCQDYSTLWNHDGLITARAICLGRSLVTLTNCGRQRSCSKTCQGCCQPIEGWRGPSFGTRSKRLAAWSGTRAAAGDQGCTTMLAPRSSTWPISEFRNIGSG
jgi:C-5 cytosine-specific DNA methylase